jgi:hypothetical protein
MKKIFGLLVLALTLTGLSSCDYDGDDDSYVTHYVTFELNQGSKYLVPVGSTYKDPGFKATEGTEDVSSKVTVSGNDQVDANSIGVYNVTYSAVNKDGYSSSATRQVVVYDPTITTDISGDYVTGDGSNRTASSIESIVGYKIKITKIADGLFYISDLFGGYYDQYRKYGANYAMTAYLYLHADNTISLISSHINGWGDSVDDLTDCKYDPQTGKITYSTGYASAMTFNIVLEK